MITIPIFAIALVALIGFGAGYNWRGPAAQSLLVEDLDDYSKPRLVPAHLHVITFEDTERYPGCVRLLDANVSAG